MPTIQGKEVGPIGLGLVPLTAHWGPAPEEQAFAVLRNAIDAGCTYLNAGEFYGRGDSNSLVLLNRYLTKYPEDAAKLLLNVKGASEPTLMPNGKPEFVRQSVDRCNQLLGGKVMIHQFECARRDLGVPLEETLGTLAALVEEGKIGGVALSEVNAQTIRQAATITKIVAVEVELSLWCREPLTNGIVHACSDLDIPILAYCPLGRGMLAGAIKSANDIPEKDMRHMLPRYQAQNLDSNLHLVQELESFAKIKGCTPAQLALGWLLSLSRKPGMPQIIPIPGTTNPERAVENTKPVDLSEQDMLAIENILDNHDVAGERYPAMFMSLTNL